MQKSVSIFWFRRDLRLHDNAGLSALIENKNEAAVLPLFIFDTEILSRLEDRDDHRVQFIHQTLTGLQAELHNQGSGLRVEIGKPLDIFQKLSTEYKIKSVYTNRDYEPKAIERDAAIEKLLEKSGASFLTFKDQVVFEKLEVCKDDGKPYTVFTPFSRKWKTRFSPAAIKAHSCKELGQRVLKMKATRIPTLEEIGFENTNPDFPPLKIDKKIIETYSETRDIPALRGTTHLGLHLRFGTVSVRDCVSAAIKADPTMAGVWLSELIWREFFMQILWNFPHVVDGPFRPEYKEIKWRNNKAEFAKWCEGKTGFPIVDAGMRELNETGFMHNRVRMIAASVLVKHLLIDWTWGEAYFARKLLDFELASNNGNWQWVAGTGCDAAPYFRVFSPDAQQKRFDPKYIYVKKWVPEYGTNSYPEPLIEPSEGRSRVLRVYAAALGREAPKPSRAKP